MKLAFIGFGDLGRYIRDTLQEVHRVPDEDHVYFDDHLVRNGAPDGKGRVFPFKDWGNGEHAAHAFYVCLGYHHLRVKRDIIRRLGELGRSVPPFIHPSAYVHPSVKMEPGTFIYPRVSIDRGTVVGRGSLIVNAGVISHDCLIGEGCYFGPGVTLSGKVTVGDCTFLGSGTTVSNDITIGSNVIVGLATSVTKNIEDGKSVIGNPMRTLERGLELI